LHRLAYIRISIIFCSILLVSPHKTALLCLRRSRCCIPAFRGLKDAGRSGKGGVCGVFRLIQRNARMRVAPASPRKRRSIAATTARRSGPEWRLSAFAATRIATSQYCNRAASRTPVRARTQAVHQPASDKKRIPDNRRGKGDGRLRFVVSHTYANRGPRRLNFVRWGGSA